MMLLTLAVLVLYAAFIEWFFGWASVLAGWQAAGLGRVAFALAILVSTYFLRTWRLSDYFGLQGGERFAALFRLAQIHNLLNIMMPFRSGEVSFPLLMKTEFAVPVASSTAALFVMRLFDLHALLAAGGVGIALESAHPVPAFLLWALFLIAPVPAFVARRPAIRLAAKVLPEKLVREISDGLPADGGAFARAWGLTLANWFVKVAALAWVLGLLGVQPLAAAFGGALGGELSSVMPMHAPAGVGTYPAGIAAGVIALAGNANDLEALGRAAVNLHLIVVVSALLGAAMALLTGKPSRKSF